jgi:2-aminoadipate transaminase
MLAALDRRMPEGTRWTRPQGGLCLWVTLPEGVSAGELYLTAIEHGVAFAVGAVFFPQDGSTHSAGRSSLRLNFAAHPPDQIDEGVRRLGRAVQEHLPGRLERDLLVRPPSERVGTSRPARGRAFELLSGGA